LVAFTYHAGSTQGERNVLVNTLWVEPLQAPSEIYIPFFDLDAFERHLDHLSKLDATETEDFKIYLNKLSAESGVHVEMLPSDSFLLHGETDLKVYYKSKFWGRLLFPA
jgi:hypothetical protein